MAHPGYKGRTFMCACGHPATLPLDIHPEAFVEVTNARGIENPLGTYIGTFAHAVVIANCKTGFCDWADDWFERVEVVDMGNTLVDY